ncbi:MAG: AAA family ATPase [Anaerolineae bacterium]|nr:AAA family ATPase [Anaerolineae bacterium]MBT7070251.1 AAA family ATPase [Anaerolineae bacterium]MBT7325865.1 AAA family ATPase [Anaerolineae bacterium]
MKEKMLNIRLIGVPRVSLDGEEIIVSRKLTRSLLFYLAANPKRIERAKLGELFWPKLDDERTQRARVRGYLGLIREAFPNTVIVDDASRGAVGLIRDALHVDVLQFSAAIAKMRSYATPWQDGTFFPPSLYQEFVNAANLWEEGDTFIDSNDMGTLSNLSNWKEEKNREFQQDLYDLYTFLARVDDALGKPEQAIFYAEKALALDKYGEKPQLILLNNLRKTGQAGKARKYYQEISEDENFDGVFSTELHNLGKELLQQREASSSYARPAWPIRSKVAPLFVGQEDTLELLNRNHHSGVGILILGEAGAGKTRLVQEFYQRLEVQPRLLFLPCHKTDENLPYQPWIDMLRHAFEPEFWKKTPAVWTKPLAMLLPELHGIRDDLGAEIGEGYATSLIFDAIRNLLIFTYQTEPCLLVVDDAHWADRASISLLGYLIHQSIFTHPNIGLAITSRAEEKTPALEQLILLSFTELETIELMRLREEEVEKLAFYVLQKSLPASALAWLRDQTGGNPYIILELLQYHFLKDKQIDLNSFSSLSTPPKVKHRFELRLENLSLPARELLLLAAMQGNPFELAVLEKAANIPINEASQMIDELENAQLIYLADKQNAGLKYAFVHEIFREGLISSLSPARSRAFHKDIAKAMESIYGEFPGSKAAVLAEHYEKADDFSKAFSLWIRAAQYAYRLFSITDANITYQRAEALIPKMALTEEEIYELYAAWGSMLFNGDEHNTLEEVMQRLQSLGEERGSSLLIGTALDGMSDVCMNRNQFERGLEYAQEALPLLESSGHIPAQMNALIHQGVFIYMLNNFPGAEENFRKALKLGEKREDAASIYAMGHANYQMATIYTGMGFPAKAISYAKESLQAMRRSGLPHGSILPYSMMGLANYFFANYEEGRAKALKCFDLAEQTDSWRMLGYASAYAGMNETELALLGEAWKHAHQAIDIGEKNGHTEIISMGYKVLGDIYSRLGALPQAAKFYSSGVAIDTGFMKLENLARLGMTLSLLGDPKGDAYLEEALTYLKATGLGSILYNTEALQLSIFIQRGEYDAFFGKVDEVKRNLSERSHPKSFVWTDYLEALYLFKEGQLEKSLTVLKKILPLLEENIFFWIRFRVYELQISLLEKLGRDSKIPHSKREIMLLQIESSLGDALIQDEWKSFATRVRGSEKRFSGVTF